MGNETDRFIWQTGQVNVLVRKNDQSANKDDSVPTLDDVPPSVSEDDNSNPQGNQVETQEHTRG